MTKVFRNEANEAVRFPYRTAEIMIPSASWLSDKDPNDFGLSGPHEIIEPEYDVSTQKIVPLPSGEYEVVELTSAEIEARKPKVVDMRQARLALLQTGRLHDISAAIESLESPKKERVSIEWEYAKVVERDSPTTLLLAEALMLSDAEIDDLFDLASSL